MPRPDMRAERIPQIIEAAMAVFARHGFVLARMDDIAQVAGLSKGTLYLYFPSKDAVIAGILETFFAHGLAELDDLLRLDSDVIGGLLNWVRRRSEELLRQPAYAAIGLEFHALAARDEPTRQMLRRSFQHYQSGVAALIQRAMELGELADSDPDITATAIMSTCEGLTVVWMINPSGVDILQVGEHAIGVLLGRNRQGK